MVLSLSSMSIVRAVFSTKKRCVKLHHFTHNTQFILLTHILWSVDHQRVFTNRKRGTQIQLELRPTQAVGSLTSVPRKLCAWIMQAQTLHPSSALKRRP